MFEGALISTLKKDSNKIKMHVDFKVPHNENIVFKKTSASFWMKNINIVQKAFFMDV